MVRTGSGYARDARAAENTRHNTRRWCSTTSQEKLIVDKRLGQLTHNGAANMVPTRHKQPTARTTVARARLTFMAQATRDLIVDHASVKGDVVAVSRIAAILAAKKTASTIPLCHPINISSVEVDFELWGTDVVLPKPGESGMDIEVTVKSLSTSGLEMEALCAAAVAGLTVYDMCKKVDKQMRMDMVRIVFKQGGRAGDWKEDGWEPLIDDQQAIDSTGHRVAETKKALQNHD